MPEGNIGKDGKPLTPNDEGFDPAQDPDMVKAAQEKAKAQAAEDKAAAKRVKEKEAAKAAGKTD